MSDIEPPRIEFPCDYPVKIIGDVADDFRTVVENIVERHAGGYDRALTTERFSANGRFVSLTVTIVATGPTQLQALFEELKATGRVHMVL
jgi:putative lipoic acid-binding regulatory protein